MPAFPSRKKPAPLPLPRPRRGILGRPALWLTLAFVILLPTVIALRASLSPRIGEITYRFDGKQAGTGSNPLFVKSQGKNLFVRFSLFLPTGQPTTFKIKPDDCIEFMTINGKNVPFEVAKFCDYTVYGRSLKLSSYLTKGENSFVLRLKDTGGKAGLRITPQYTTLSFMLLNQGPLLLILLYVIALLWPAIRRSSVRPLWMVGIGGAVLRIFYFSVTPYTMRGNDTQAHLDYITYVASHWTIPPASDGWEFHQAPLYYFLSALWMKAGLLLHLSKETIPRIIHFQSLLFSIGILAVGIWIGTLLFTPKQKTGRLLFACLLASFPSLIYHSVSITNNSLYLLLVFLFLAFLIQWWKKPSTGLWYLLVLILAVTFITRVSALIFVLVLGPSLLFHDKIPWRMKSQRALLASLLFVLLVGWLPFIRFVVEKNPTNSLTFSSQSMNSKLAVPTDAGTFLIFNPIRVLRSPYANPWKDTSPREYFWEYFFRSAFFGEFSYPDELKALAALILVCSLTLLPFLVFGLVTLTLRHSHWVFPLGLIIIFVLGAHFFFRIFAPFSANQDFRFSLAMIPALIFYLVWGIRSGPKSLRPIGTYIAIAFASLAAIFVVLLGFFTV